MTTVQRQMMWVTTLAFAACVAGAAVYVLLPAAPSTKVTELNFSLPAGEANFEYSLVVKTVSAQLRDPNSAKFGPMLAYRFQQLNGRSGTAVCGTVIAKNETGAYDDPKEFVFISNPVSAVIDPATPDSDSRTCGRIIASIGAKLLIFG
jgi:hypothetical protein